MERAKPTEQRLEDGTRIIRKPDGTIVTLLPDGRVVIEDRGGARITHTPDGTTVMETAAGERTERHAKLPRSRRPLNVASMTPEEIGKWMSNFAPAPFTLDGVRYSCVEAFYVCLKFPDDPAMKARIRTMEGREAKRAGSKQKTTMTRYRDAEFLLGSAEHHALIKRAIRAKLEQNAEIAQAFAATHPRPIIHDTGREDKPGTALPGKDFCRILTELRDELVRRAAE
jgi:predicted NAD-dependent protein-ADP-ribosyltransferase YbiA (DUF1768 family)